MTRPSQSVDPERESLLHNNEGISRSTSINSDFDFIPENYTRNTLNEPSTPRYFDSSRLFQSHNGTFDDVLSSTNENYVKHKDSFFEIACSFITCGFWRPNFSRKKHTESNKFKKPTSFIQAIIFLFQTLYSYIEMLITWKTFKATVCYMICTAISITPTFNDMFKSNGYLFVTAVLYFHPARTVGAMLESILICYIGIAFGVLIANICLQIAYYYHADTGKDSRHIASTFAFLSLALVSFLLAFIRARFGSKRASINTGCTMAHILTFLTITEIPNENALPTLQIRIYRVAGSLLLGSLVSFLGCILIKPTTAASGLREDIYNNIENFETFLEAAEDTILGPEKSSDKMSPFHSWLLSKSENQEHFGASNSSKPYEPIPVNEQLDISSSNSDGSIPNPVFKLANNNDDLFTYSSFLEGKTPLPSGQTPSSAAAYFAAAKASAILSEHIPNKSSFTNKLLHGRSLVSARRGYTFSEDSMSSHSEPVKPKRAKTVIFDAQDSATDDDHGKDLISFATNDESDIITNEENDNASFNKKKFNKGKRVSSNLSLSLSNKKNLVLGDKDGIKNSEKTSVSNSSLDFVQSPTGLEANETVGNSSKRSSVSLKLNVPSASKDNKSDVSIEILQDFENKRLNFHKDVQELIKKHSRTLLHLEVSRYEVTFEIFSSVYLHRVVYGRIFHCIERLTQHIGGLKSSLFHIEKQFDNASDANKFHTYVFIDTLELPMRRLLTTCSKSLDVLKDVVMTPQSQKDTYAKLEKPLRNLAESMIFVLQDFSTDQRAIPVELFKHVTDEILLIFVFIFELEELAKEIITLIEQVLVLVLSINEMHNVGRWKFTFRRIFSSPEKSLNIEHPIWLELSKSYFTTSKNMSMQPLSARTPDSGNADRLAVNQTMEDLGYSPGAGFNDVLRRSFNNNFNAIDVTYAPYPPISNKLNSIRERNRARFFNNNKFTLSMPQDNIEKILDQQEKERGSTLVDQFNFNAWSALMNLRKFEFRFAFKTAVSLCILCLPAFLQSTQDFYYEWKLNWSMASFIVVMTPNVGGTNKAGFLRLLGTVGGALAAIITGWISEEENSWKLLLCSLLVAVPSFWGRFHTQYDKIGHIFLITYSIAALRGFNGNVDPSTGRTSSITEVAIRRGVAVFVGVSFGMLVSWYVWPFTARRALRIGLSNVLFDIGLLYGKLVSILNNSSSDLTEKSALKKFFDSELTLRLALAECNSLLALTDHEPRMKGRFPKEVYAEILESCGNVLDKLISMRVAIGKSSFNSVKNEFVEPLQELRKPLISSTMLYFYVLSTVLVVRYPVPPLPETRKYREQLISHVRTLPVIQPENLTSHRDIAYMYYYAYVVGMEDIMDDLDTIGDCLQYLFGRMTEQSQVIFDHNSVDNDDE